MMRPNSYHLKDGTFGLDDGTVTEVTIGLEDGPGGRFRPLQRMRTTVRGAIRRASRTAQVIAGECEERLLDPTARPAAIRVSEHGEGATILLDYDVRGRGGRVSRPLRLIMLTRSTVDGAS